MNKKTAFTVGPKSSRKTVIATANRSTNALLVVSNLLGASA
jgi:hypothetical protein